MSVMNDKWIIEQCTHPTHTLHHPHEIGASFIQPPYSDEELFAINNWDPVACREKIMDQIWAKPISTSDFKPMIYPFSAEQVRYVDIATGEPVVVAKGDTPPATVRRILSYGTSSYGYDVRLADDPDEITVFTNVYEAEIDPKRMKESNFAKPGIHIDEDGAKYILIPAQSYVQGPTVEYFNVPDDVLIIVVGKSTLARSGLCANVTPIEPGFSGQVVVEIANLTSSPVRCYLNEGICQFVIIKGNERCLTSYADRGGKYQGQINNTYAKV